MKILGVAILCFFYITPVGQNAINGPRRKITEPITKKLLFGKWKSDKDKAWILKFKNSICIEYYGKEAVDTMYYSLSKSCNVKDSAKLLDGSSTYLIFSGASDTSFHQCNEILTLDKHALSYMITDIGKIQVFSKVNE